MSLTSGHVREINFRCRRPGRLMVWILVAMLAGGMAAAEEESPISLLLAESNARLNATSGKQLAWDQIPRQLEGPYKLSLCVKAPGHAWLRFEHVKSQHVVTISRFHRLAGGEFNWRKLRYDRKPAGRSGLWMNRELSLEPHVRNGYYILLSVRVDDPVIYRGQANGKGHGSVVNNCATYCRDAWKFYTGEHYEFPGLHTPILLRNAVVQRHPEVLPE